MAKPELTIKFKADSSSLKTALNQLDVATKKITSSTKIHNKQLKKAKSSQDRFTKSAQKTNQKLRIQTGAFATLRSNLLLYSFGVALAQRAMIQFVEKSSKVENLQKGFDSLTQTIDSTGDSLLKLQQATDGTVNRTDLLTQANNAMMLGVVKSDEEMAQLFDTAQRLGQALGRDTVSSIESLVTGMGRQSRLMLDNLGIIVKTEDAYKEYAKSIGVSTANLTDQQKKTAFNVKALSIAEKMVKDLGKENLNAASDLQRMETALHDMSVVLGEVLEPSVKLVAAALQAISRNMNPDVLKVYAAAITLTSAAWAGYTFAVTGATVATKTFLRVTKIGIFLAIAGGIAEMTTRFFGLRDSVDESDDGSKKYNDTLSRLNKNTNNSVVSILNQVKSYEELIKIGQKHNTNQLNIAKTDKKRIEDLIQLKQAEIESAQTAIAASKDIGSQKNQNLIAAQSDLAFAKTEAVKRKALLDELTEKQKKNSHLVVEGLFEAKEAYISSQKTIKDYKENVESLSKVSDAAASNMGADLIKIMREELKALGFSLEETNAIIEGIEVSEDDKKKADALKTLNEETKASINLIKAKNIEDGVSGTTAEKLQVLAIQKAALETQLNESLGEQIDIQGELNTVNGEIHDIEMERHQQKIANAIEMATAVTNIMGKSVELEMQQSKAAQKEAINATASIRNERIRQKEIDKINKKYAAEQEKINEKSKKAKKTQTIINTAVGIMEVWADKSSDLFTKIAFTALVAAAGAQSVKQIDSQKYRYGGLVGGSRHSQGGTMIEAEQGEFVMSREATEAVGIENLNRMNTGLGGGGGASIVINNPVLGKDTIEDEIVPQIKEALRRGGSIA